MKEFMFILSYVLFSCFMFIRASVNSKKNGYTYPRSFSETRDIVIVILVSFFWLLIGYLFNLL